MDSCSNVEESQNRDKQIYTRGIEFAGTEQAQHQSEEKVIAKSPASYDLVHDKPKLHWRTWAVLFAGIISYASINWGVAALSFWSASAVAQIGGGTVSLWYAEGFLVTQVAIQPLFGSIADFSPFVRKFSCISLLTFAAVGLFIAGSAQEMVPQGIIGALFFGTGLVAYGGIGAIISDVFPHTMRGFVASCLYAASGIGGFLGDVAGGAMLQHGGPDGWRWNNYAAGSAMLLSAVLLLVMYKPIRRPTLPDDLSFLQKLARFDWIGGILFGGGVVPFLMALIWGGSTYPWKSAQALVPLVVGLGCFITLVLHQAFVKTDGIFDRRLWGNRNFAIALFSIFIEGIVYISLSIFLGQQVATLYSKSPIVQGMHFGVILLLSSFIGILWGYYTQRFREAKIPLVLGYLGFAACCAGFSQLTPSSSDGVVYAICALLGIAFSSPEALLIAVAQLAVPAELIGTASNHFFALRSLGAAIGASISSAIFSAKIKTYLPKYIAEAAAAAGVSGDNINIVVAAVASDTSGKVISIPGVSAAQITAAQAGSLKAYAASYAYIYYSIIPWAVAAAIALACMRSLKESMTWEIDQSVETKAALLQVEDGKSQQ